MNWGLFCQIEVIILTIGLVGSFLISFSQNSKDNSFAKRTKIIGEVLNEIGKGITESKNSADMAKLKQMIEAYKENQKKD